ncbi:MAG: hypothetical protein ACSLEX_02420 [Minisyncoccota bacterium]
MPYREKNNSGIPKPRTSSLSAFLITFVFVTVSAGLVWLDFFRSYEAEVSVLITTRIGAENTAPEITDNASELIHTLSFYERLLQDNEDINDMFVGMNPDIRKARWNDIVTVEKSEKNGVLIIRVSCETPEQAKYLATQIAHTLFTTLGFYYDVKTNIDMRIIDGPLVKYTITSVPGFILLSILSGGVITSVFFGFLFLVPRISITTKYCRQRIKKRSVKEESALSHIGEAVPWIDPIKFIPQKPTMLSFEGIDRPDILSIQTKKEEKKMTLAPAPANLPISDFETVSVPETAVNAEPIMPRSESTISAEDALFSHTQGESLGFPTRGEHAIASKVVSTKEDASVSMTSKTEEPTVAEYKHRLNALLSDGE